MESIDTVVEVVAELIVDAELSGHRGRLQSFDDFVIALSLDSGLPAGEVQSRLVAKMLENGHPRYRISNITYLWGAGTNERGLPRPILKS